MKTRYDSGATGHHFKEGDQVWMYNPKRRRGLSPKLQQNWEGPYTIVKKLNDVIYRVQRSPNAKPKRRGTCGAPRAIDDRGEPRLRRCVRADRRATSEQDEPRGYQECILHNGSANVAAHGHPQQTPG
ncbi:hypothetical protein AVEN_143143-1 [Araneus ventricosus]|uniref:Integrase p58-like C-terminal domain-containing protein n=1 Tax=Araneus ventricosus TaxID=182803 RepID=A0A4Y2X663_ARAVE|nr:hypothetical protein AVEN_143143-1 [Araneus ventricosus]